jgi:sugar diacid utilization regulator
MSFALEFAALIEQSRAFEEMRQREEVTAALYEIAYMISEGTEIDVIIRLILEKLKMYLKTEVVGYCSFDTVCKESHCLMLHGSKELSECKFSGVFPLSFWERLDHEDLLLTNLNQLAFPPEFGDWVKRNQLVYGLFSPIQSSERTPRMMFALDRNHRHVTGRKQDLLKRFVQQAALAVQRSDLESKQRDLVEKLQHTNNVLMYAVNIHSKLMQMILEGGQYESFAKTIQELVQGKVVLFDEHFQPLSDEHLLGHEILELVTKDIKPRIPFFGTISLELDELLIHVSSSTDGSSIFGYVMVVKTKDAVDHFDRVAIEQAALLLALRQMQRKIEMELEGRLVFEWLDDVLTGSTSEEVLLRRGKHLGFTDSRCSYLLLCGIERMNNHEGIHRILSERQPIYSTIRQQLSNYQWSNFITVRGDTIAILLLQDETETSDISERASTLFQWIQRKFPNHIRRGVLMMFDGNLGSLRLAYEDGEKILSLMRSTDKQGLVESGDLGSYRFFLRSHNYEQLKQFAFQTLEPLFRLDTQQREVLLQTLAVYTEGGGELKETAERLHVHRNTLIYRLKKIEDLLGTNIRNSDKRFDIQLACRIYNLFESLAEK